MDRRTDDGRTTEPAYTISSPGAFGSGELKKSGLSMVCWRLFTGMYQITVTICIIMYAVVNEKVDKPDPWRLSHNLSLYL